MIPLQVEMNEKIVAMLVRALTFLHFLRVGPTVLEALIRRVLVRLVFNPVLLEVRIVQVLLQGSHERYRGLRQRS
jgi:hypothetical protein